MTRRLNGELTGDELALLEAIGMPGRHRVLLRRPVTIAFARRAWLPGLLASVLAYGLAGNPGAELASALIAAPLFVAALVAHELGHLALGRFAGGITPRMIVMRPAGGVAVVEGRYEDPRGAALFAIGGPFATALATMLLLLGALLAPAPLRAGLLVPAALNAALLVVNLLPFAPMDGYLLFRSAVWAGLGNRAEAERRAIDWSRAALVWGMFLTLVALERNSRYGLLALVFVATFTLQHHTTVRRTARASLRKR
jgi:Zn-dependent protease